MSARSPERAPGLVQQILDAVDPRLAPSLRAELAQPGPSALPAPAQTLPSRLVEACQLLESEASRPAWVEACCYFRRLDDKGA